MSGRVAFLLSAAAMLLFPAILNRPITVFLMEAPGGPVISAGDHGRQPVCEVGDAPCRRGRNELLSHGEFLVFGDSKKATITTFMGGFISALSRPVFQHRVWLADP